jgi:radical SAM protein with 4Fe4S-binding SPASM domain
MSGYRLKTLLHRGYKYLERREHRLWYLFLEITRRCNLSCLHCGSDCRSESSASHLDTAHWLEIIAYMRRHFGRQLAFIITGGEPLLHPDLDVIGKTIFRAGMRWGMVSNGYALSATRLQQLEASGIYSLTLSLDGPRDAHNWLRNRPDAFDRAIQALTVIGQSAIPFRDVVTCVYPGNLAALNETAQLLLQARIPSWRLFRIFPSGRAAANADLLLSQAQTQQMLAWIAENRAHYRRQGLEIQASCEGWLPLAQDLRVRNQPFFCRAGINVASILCDGTITGCSNNHSSFYEGNIQRDDFHTLWQNGFQKYRDRGWIQATSCGQCRYFRDCQGGSIHLWKFQDNEPAFCYLDSATVK